MIRAERKRTYNTYNKFRLSLFTRSYAGYSISNFLRIRYKIDGKLTGRELKRQFGNNKRIIPEISKLSKVLNFHYKSLWKFIVLAKTPKIILRIHDREKVKVYLGIESEITALSITKQGKGNLIEEEYKKAILIPAIERVAGNHLKNIEDDKVFDAQLEVLQRKYQNWYYATAYKYKLPTSRITPFITK